MAALFLSFIHCFEVTNRALSVACARFAIGDSMGWGGERKEKDNDKRS